MERARRLANRAILKRLVNGSKQSHNQARNESSLLNSSSSVSCTPSRCLSSLSSFGSTSPRSGLFPGNENSISHNVAAVSADATVPKSIGLDSMKFSKFDGGLTESQMIEHMKYLASKNKVFKSSIGMGYYDTHVPPVILRNIMQNPAWYTQYTQYQAEISQGRLESLLNYQTMITDLTGLPMSNASLLDEGTAAAEAMAMCNNILNGKKKTFIIATNFHPQTIDICKTTAGGFNLKDIDYKSGYVMWCLTFLATSQEYKRMTPGRIIGVSVDSSGKPALRMAMQTREQHIRRDKATSNICTAQALLANMAAMYAVYHGPGGLKTIAQRVHGLAEAFAVGLKKLGTVEVQGLPFFDTVKVPFTAAYLAPEVQNVIPSGLTRESPYLAHPIFNMYHTEHELLRYMHRLQSKDLSVCHSMIPLGSCTMKLNATSEMMPVTFPNFTDIHLLRQVNILKVTRKCSMNWVNYCVQLLDLTLSHCNLMLVLLESVLGLWLFVPIIRYGDAKYSLKRLLIQYPSTHGVYEEGLDEIILDNGGQVYMDGANMNAQVGLTSPGFIGADVCDLNLHKTFCIPHGGDGPGMGPVGLSDASKIAILNANYMVKRLEVINLSLIRFLAVNDDHSMWPRGRHSKIQEKNYYPILFRGVNGTVAHEFIVDLRGFKNTAGIEPEDVAKRLTDYVFHAPTMSWPVPGTLMIEPTESESKAELDRFCDALISIREETAEIEKGKADIHNNVLKGVPHPPSLLMGDAWTKPYSGECAAFPASWFRVAKFWPSSGRVDNVYGDRNLIFNLLSASHVVEGQAAATASYSFPHYAMQDCSTDIKVDAICSSSVNKFICSLLQLVKFVSRYTGDQLL
ncbi:hypothetical protein POTOM_055956 [Populus tomentosa]|uniref:Glycine dehydrogenase (aminomethyl-transferring) n=1 Tax=Populus tomentosa TaxID=118781 RepID=A0A8X7XZ04_POPTO|nr:hypothetical protein POTOM_055956 [Populus tomentosa]